jgi:hypothetical protein
MKQAYPVGGQPAHRYLARVVGDSSCAISVRASGDCQGKVATAGIPPVNSAFDAEDAVMENQMRWVIRIASRSGHEDVGFGWSVLSRILFARDDFLIHGEARQTRCKHVRMERQVLEALAESSAQVKSGQVHDARKAVGKLIGELKQR